MEFSSEGEDENDEEVDQLLESLNGIEKCFLLESPDVKTINEPVAAEGNPNPNPISNCPAETKENETCIPRVSNMNLKIDATFTTATLNTSLSFFADQNSKDIRNILDSLTEKKGNTDDIVLHLSDDESIVDKSNKRKEEPSFSHSKCDPVNLDEILIGSHSDSVIELSQDKDSDSDIVLEKICGLQNKNDNVQSASEERQDLPDGVTYICTMKNVAQNTTDVVRSTTVLQSKVSESDSDCDIIEHLKSAPYRQNGFIDLTVNLSDEENIENDDTKNKSLKNDDTETLLKEISKIRRALVKRKKKKKRKSKAHEKKHSRSRSGSMSNSSSEDGKKMYDSDEDKVDKRLCSYILPNQNQEVEKHQKSKTHFSEYRARSRRSPERYRRKSRSRERSYRYHDRKKSRSRRRSKESLYGRHERKKRSSLSQSSTDSVKRRRECSPLEHIREQLRKENESAVKSLMNVNKMNQLSSVVEGQVFAANPPPLSYQAINLVHSNADCMNSANVSSSEVESQIIPSTPLHTNQIMNVDDINARNNDSANFLPHIATVQIPQYIHPGYPAMYHQNYASYSYCYGGALATPGGYLSQINVQVRQLYSHHMPQNPSLM